MIFQPTCILVTGGAGFIGSNLIRWVLGRSDQTVIINFDALTYAGNLDRLTDVSTLHGSRPDGRYFFVHGDIRDFHSLRRIFLGNARESLRDGGTGRVVPSPDAVVHCAAESHVDRSIMGPAAFVETNISGTVTLLEACREYLGMRPSPFRFLHVSTDEVYGSIEPSDPAFTENTPLAPSSPYSASKAAADLLIRSWTTTFGFPALITRCSNNYGPYQYPEKLIPLMITRALRDQPLPVYGDGMNVRDWIHVDDHAEALWTVLTGGTDGALYNVGSECELTNLDMVRRLLRLLSKPESLIQFVRDRPGHDRRYAINSDRLRRELNWSPRRDIAEGLSETVAWYLANRAWWEPMLGDAYLAANDLYMRPERGGATDSTT